jgi:hypothetical protein
MAPIVAGTHVDRPAAEVFAYVTDPTCFSEMAEGRRERSHGRPGDTAGRGPLHDHTPDRVRRAALDVTVEPTSEVRSHVSIVVDFVGHGIGRVLVPLMVGREAGKEMPANVAALKQRMDAMD